MSNATRLRRSAMLAALTCALLAATATAIAAAQPNEDAHCRVQLGAGLPFVPCYHAPDPQRKSTRTRSDESRRLAAALAQERYYSSYGEPEPLILPRPSAPSDKTPRLPIAVAIAVALAVVAAGATRLRRLRVRRRAPHATT